ncbi:MAG: CaiB/BaiF CoA-transferase family protein [Burkholderiaceae bacterium]
MGAGLREHLAARFPRLIYCTISGYGNDGPLAGLPGYDAVAQAMSGLMSINGDPASGPTRIGIPLVDLATGMNATIGILLALAERARSGRGQRIETALFDNALALLHPHASEWLLAKHLNGLTGNRHPVSAPYEPFTAGGAPIFIGVVADRQFTLLCRTLGLDDMLADPRFQGLAARLENRDEMHDIIQARIVDENADALCTRLMRAGVPAGAMHTVAEALDHPQTAARGMLVSMGGYRGVGIPVKLARTPGSVRRTPPRPGADGPEIDW